MSLEEITAITKINPRHLMALEEGRFRLLPGGILSKGIVRSYAEALGLDSQEWTQRFMRACDEAGAHEDEDEDWTEFAANVGRARIQRHDAVEIRMRWIGAILLLAAIAGCAYLVVRYYGLKAGWWHTLLPVNEFFVGIGQIFATLGAKVEHLIDWINH